MTDIYINGGFVHEEDAVISVMDRAVQLGDGLFETIRGHCGKPAFLEKINEAGKLDELWSAVVRAASNR